MYVCRICTSRTGIKMDQISIEAADLFLISSNGHSSNVNIELQGYRDALHKVVIQVSRCIQRDVIFITFSGLKI